jgi:hypothetical protein
MIDGPVYGGRPAEGWREERPRFVSRGPRRARGPSVMTKRESTSLRLRHIARPARQTGVAFTRGDAGLGGTLRPACGTDEDHRVGVEHPLAVSLFAVFATYAAVVALGAHSAEVGLGGVGGGRVRRRGGGGGVVLAKAPGRAAARCACRSGRRARRHLAGQLGSDLRAVSGCKRGHP